MILATAMSGSMPVELAAKEERMTANEPTPLLRHFGTRVIHHDLGCRIPSLARDGDSPVSGAAATRASPRPQPRNPPRYFGFVPPILPAEASLQPWLLREHEVEVGLRARKLAAHRPTAREPQKAASPRSISASRGRR
jgi:hypothetical protein